MKTALVLFAHGAREAEWALPFGAIREKVASSRADLTVELAFLELMKPELEACISRLAASGHRRVTIAPLFLALGGHLRRDLPQLIDGIRDRYGFLDIVVLPPIGEVQTLVEAIAGWLVNAAPR